MLLILILFIDIFIKRQSYSLFSMIVSVGNILVTLQMGQLGSELQLASYTLRLLINRFLISPR